MTDAEIKRAKHKIKYRRKVSKRYLGRILKFKRAGYQLFSFMIFVFSIAAFYFLIWGLIIEPNLPLHIYGVGDFKELIYLLIALLIVSVSYFIILLINYKPLNMVWWDNLRLLYSVKFNLDKYSALKNMGINYHHQKRKIQSIRRRNSPNNHKSITE